MVVLLLALLAVDRPALPAFALPDLQGKTVRLEAGQVTVLSFWATWCVPCLQELGHLQEFAQANPDKKFTLLAIATDGPQTLSQVRSVARQKKWSMPVLLDSAGSVSAVLNPRGVTPYTIFVDKRGGVAHRHEGFAAADGVMYQTWIKALLDE